MPHYKLVISDTSCLISLERIDSHSLLGKLFDGVVVTEEVATEFGTVLPGFFSVRPSPGPVTQELLDRGLDLGEASSIALSLEIGRDCMLLLDDKAARDEAERRGLAHIGLLGVLLRAKENGTIDNVGPYIEQLRDIRFRMSEALIENVLRMAGEWE